MKSSIFPLGAGSPILINSIASGGPVTSKKRKLAEMAGGPPTDIGN
jgi:hypothetical protein